MMLGRVALAFVALAASPSLVPAQGISNQRDAYGNLVHNNGMPAQNAPRPMTNNVVRTVQSPQYHVIRAPRRSVLIRR
jgi:hypothetical protein